MLRVFEARIEQWVNENKSRIAGQLVTSITALYNKECKSTMSPTSFGRVLSTLGWRTEHTVHGNRRYPPAEKKVRYSE